MITGEHSILRTAEADDAFIMRGLYHLAEPRAALLDQRREQILPNVDEVREILARRDRMALQYYCVEDLSGEVRGFAGLRGAPVELRYAEAVMVFLDDADYAAPIAHETFDFLRKTGFVERRLNKLMCHCLDTESALKAFLIETGFLSEGVQREVLYARGRWYNLETFTLFHEPMQEPAHADHE